MEYVYTQLIVCGVVKASIFSQEIIDKKCIPTGSCQEKNALIKTFLYPDSLTLYRSVFVFKTELELCIQPFK